MPAQKRWCGPGRCHLTLLSGYPPWNGAGKGVGGGPRSFAKNTPSDRRAGGQEPVRARAQSDRLASYQPSRW
jgi:hypothetical protein